MIERGAPAISVVLATYNRGALLADAVRSLLALDPASPPHEIVVVDNNSTDDTRRVVERLIPESGGRLRYAFEGRQGVSHARNRGVAVARGDVIAFTDDDVRVTPDWLLAIARAVAEHPEATFVGGRVLPIWPGPPPRWLTPDHWSPLALVDYGAEPFAIGPVGMRCLVSANLACRRDAFVAVGGFDPRHQHERGAVSAAEDHELELRLLSAGHVGWYDPRIVIRAEVQANRLTKAYHRKWRFDHGRAVMRLLPPGWYFDGDGVRRPLPPGARTVFGAPLFLYRSVARGLVAWARHAVRGDDARALRSLGEAWESLGSMTYLAGRRDRTVSS